MDDKTTRNQHSNNQDDEVNLFRRNSNSRRRQRKRRTPIERVKESDTQTEPFDEERYVIHRHNEDKESSKEPQEKEYDKEKLEPQEKEKSHYDDKVSGARKTSKNDKKENSRGDSKTAKTTPFSKSRQKTDSSEERTTEEKSPPLTIEEKRQLRRKRQKRIQYSIITVLILLILIILLYMFSPLSKVSHVNVEGNKHVSTSKIKNELNIKSNTRMYTFSKRKAIDKLKEDPLIKDVDIDKQLPNTLNVSVQENSVLGLVKQKNKYIPLLENGKFLKDTSNAKVSNVPILDGFKGEKENQMVKALRNMTDESRQFIAEISYSPEKNRQNRIEIFTTDGLQVIGDISTISDKMKYYPQMSQSLSRDKSGNLKTNGYIDLSVGASFIPYHENSTKQSESQKNVNRSTQQETQAKDELQSVLNKINQESSKNN